ncbi:MAG TPA: serine/threonine-protein kinase [Kofleriaceae bacterium]
MADGVVSAAKLPPRIGRHAVLGYLADGGMAEIFLGRELDGRPIVIKRILPHLARQQNFVSMFIDEARIGSLVKHPNVVQIYELGQVGTDLFMVMEYLAGESVSGLLRRCELRHEQLQVALGAYVIAEACAGLHAAHDLRDESGEPLGVVHRDISPSNLFITYSGDVKVLDFGIATAHDRLSRTATGHVKGKFSYMSPEQCLGIALDAHSDLWSLGVVLYELTTQRRLFKRPNELLVLKAVTQDPIPRPRRELPDYPELLERIVMRALEREPTRRYHSALELRGDLLDAMAQLGFTGDPRSELARVMEHLFPERITEKLALLSQLRAGTDIDSDTLPVAEVDENVELAQMPEPSAHSAARTPSKSSASWIVVVAVLLVATAGGFTWWYSQRTPAVPKQPALPDPVVTMPVAPTPQPAPVAAIAPAPEPAPSGLTLRIETVPAGAAIKIDGVARGVTPIDFKLDEPRSVKLALSLAGFVDVKQQLAIDHDQRVLIPLAPKPKPAVVKPPAKKKKDPKDPFQRFD